MLNTLSISALCSRLYEKLGPLCFTDTPISLMYISAFLLASCVERYKISFLVLITLIPFLVGTLIFLTVPRCGNSIILMFSNKYSVMMLSFPGILHLQLKLFCIQLF